MVNKKEKSKRKKGYYWDEGTQRYYVSITTFLRSCGDQSGLIYWGIKQASTGLVHRLAQIQDIAELSSRLKESTAQEWGYEQAKQAYSSALNRTSTIGTHVHKGIELLLLDSPEYEIHYERSTELEKIMMNTFKEFYKPLKFKPLLIEEPQFNIEAGYAGTPDFIGGFTKKDVQDLQPYLKSHSHDVAPGSIIFDIKTGSIQEVKHAAQLACGAYAWDLLHPKQKITGGIIANITRDNPEEIQLVYFTREYLDKVYDNFTLPGLKMFNFTAPKWYREQFVE